MNGEDIRHVATCVLLEMAQRAEQTAWNLAAVAGEPKAAYPYRSSDPSVQERTKMWTRIKWLRSTAKEYRAMAEQPERDEFDRLRKNFEWSTALRGCSLRIGDPKESVGSAIDLLKKLQAIVDTWPGTHGPQAWPEGSAEGAAPPAPSVPVNNCDCEGCDCKKAAP
jgi:hypothetical protein